MLELIYLGIQLTKIVTFFRSWRYKSSNVITVINRLRIKYFVFKKTHRWSECNFHCTLVYCFFFCILKLHVRTKLILNLKGVFKGGLLHWTSKKTFAQLGSSIFVSLNMIYWMKHNTAYIIHQYLLHKW